MSDSELSLMQELLLNLEEIVAGWETMEVMRICRLTPWEQERLMFARKAIEKTKELERQHEQ